jgi:hypothetical protein
MEIKILALSVFFLSACGDKAPAPARPPAAMVGTGNNNNLDTTQSTCTAKSCPRVKEFRINPETQIERDAGVEFGGVLITVQTFGRDSARAVQLILDSTQQLPNGLSADVSGNGVTLKGKINSPNTYSIALVVRDMESCKNQTKSNADNCESSKSYNDAYDIKVNPVSLKINRSTAGSNSQQISNVADLNAASRCNMTNNIYDTYARNQAIMGAGSILGSVINGTSSTGGIIGGAIGVLGGLFGPKPQQPVINARDCY